MPTDDSFLTRIVIRSVSRADVPGITAIYAHHVRHGLASWEYDAPDQQEIARRLDDLLSKGFPYLVATIGEQLIGYAYAGMYRSRPGYRFTVENSVYIASGWERRGVGRKLLAALIDACEQRGYRQMVAVIGDSENRSSIEMHRALGFGHVGLLPNIGFKAGRWLDSVLMQRTLGAGATTLPEAGDADERDR